MIAVYPGTFDPITLGHMDIINPASKLYDHVIVAVSSSDAKSPLLNIETRTALVKESVTHIPNVTVESYNGLTINLLVDKKADVLVRGVRNIIDCEFELTLLGMYKAVMPELEIVLLPASSNVAFISSTLVRDFIRHQGQPDAFVPKPVATYLKNHFLK